MCIFSIACACVCVCVCVRACVSVCVWTPDSAVHKILSLQFNYVLIGTAVNCHSEHPYHHTHSVIEVLQKLLQHWQH